MTNRDHAILSPKKIIGLYLALLALIVIAYWRLPQNGFIYYDDPVYVTNNPDVYHGLTLEGIKWAFTAMHASNWHPLTWISHMLDCQLFGLNPRAHHLVNLAFHGANTILLFLLLRRLTGSLWGSWFVTALFAIHPMHVESVAWVSERKDVLSTFFGLLTLLAYHRYADEDETKSTAKKWMAYFMAVVCFALGLLSKPMLVTLPCVLLLLDFWPLRRFEADLSKTNVHRFLRLILEKIPFFLLTVAACVLTVVAQSRGGSVAPTFDITLDQRIENSVIAYGWYVWRMFVPVDQAIIYPLMPQRELWQVIIGAIFLVVITAFALVQARRRPWLIFGWFWFLGVLVPVIGFVQVGMQAYADRYTYLSYVGLFIAIVWTIDDRVRESSLLRRTLVPCGLVILTLCIGGIWHLLPFWKNDEALFRRAIAVTEKNYIALYNLGYTLSERGEYDEAIKYCDEALQIAPEYADAFNTIGCAKLAKKNPTDAMVYFDRAIEFKPNNAAYRNNFGTALYELGRYEEAAQAYEAGLQIDPRSFDCLYNLGNTLVALDQVANAVASYERAAAIKPESPQVHLNLANALLKLKQSARARSEFEKALALDPADSAPHYGLGQIANDEGDFSEAEKHWRQFLVNNPENVSARILLVQALGAQGKIADALVEAKELVRRAPESAISYFWLGTALEQNAQLVDAIHAYEKSVALNSNEPAALNNLAWLLATNPDGAIRDGKRAVTLAQQACDLTKRESALFLGTLAAAFAEAGDFTNAVSTGESARDVANKSSQTEIARENEKLLLLYRAGKTYRDLQAEPATK